MHPMARNHSARPNRRQTAPAYRVVRLGLRPVPPADLAGPAVGAAAAAARDAVRAAARGGVEPLEERVLFATFTVTNTLDSGAGSLRTAITSANNAAGADTIAFAIPGTGTHTITPATALPAI